MCCATAHADSKKVTHSAALALMCCCSLLLACLGGRGGKLYFPPGPLTLSRGLCLIFDSDRGHAASALQNQPLRKRLCNIMLYTTHPNKNQVVLLISSQMKPPRIAGKGRRGAEEAEKQRSVPFLAHCEIVKTKGSSFEWQLTHPAHPDFGWQD